LEKLYIRVGNNDYEIRRLKASYNTQEKLKKIKGDETWLIGKARIVK